MQNELPFAKREEFEAMLASRELSPDARALLLLMHSAANGTPAKAIEGRLVSRPRPVYVMVAESQAAVAAAAGLRSERAVRAACGELEGLRLFVRRTVSVATGGRQTAYYADLGRLVDLPELDRATAIGRAVAELLHDWPFPEVDDVDADFSAAGAVPVGSPVGSPVPCRSAAGTPPVGLPVDQDPVDQELIDERAETGKPQGRRRSFSELNRETIRAIAGFRVAELDGAALPPAARVKLAGEFFADALVAGFATPDEFVLFVSLCRHVSMREKRMRDGRSIISDAGRYLRTCWKNRADANRPLVSTLTDDDKRYGRELAELAERIETTASEGRSCAIA